MKSKNNSLMKIIMGTGVCIFDLFAVFVASAAWFTASRQVDQEADSFKVTNYTGLVTNISVYTLKERNTNYVYNETPSVSYDVDINGKLTKQNTNSKPFSMGEYDQLESPNNSVLYIITLDADIARNQKKVSFTANTTGTRETSPLTQGKLKADGNSLSSIVKFHKVEEEHVLLQPYGI